MNGEQTPFKGWKRRPYANTLAFIRPLGYSLST